MFQNKKQLIILLLAFIAAAIAEVKSESVLLGRLVPTIVDNGYYLTPGDNEYNLFLAKPDDTSRSERVTFAKDPSTGIESLVVDGQLNIQYPNDGGFVDWSYKADANGNSVKYSYTKERPPPPPGVGFASASFLKSATG